MRLIWYRLTRWLRFSPAVRPLLLVVGGLVLAVGASQTQWPETAQRGEILASLGTIAGAALFLLTTSLARVLAQISFATGLYSPRLAARLLSRPVVVLSLSLLAATFVCAGVSTLIIVVGEADDPGVLSLIVSGALLALGFLGFIALNANMTKTFRVSNVVATTSRDGLREVDRLYPLPVEGGHETPARAEPPTGQPDQTVRAGDDTYGVLLGFFAPWLVGVAHANRATIVIAPAVGDFVEPGTPLIHVFGPKPIRERTLLAGIRLGEGRTIEQDPLFALRLLVDVAVRALSPAVNDPYTAVQSLDRIAQLLAVLGRRDLGEGWRADHAGAVRLWYATPDWDDYVLLAFTEVRGFGAGVMPVARRLRAVLVDLQAIVPSHRSEALEVQLGLLDDAVAAAFPNPTEREQAMTPDRQGIGASTLGAT